MKILFVCHSVSPKSLPRVSQELQKEPPKNSQRTPKIKDKDNVTEEEEVGHSLLFILICFSFLFFSNSVCFQWYLADLIDVVFPRFYVQVSVWVVILMRPGPRQERQPHFMATLPSLLRFKIIPKLTNLAIKKLYRLPLQAFCIHKI